MKQIITVDQLRLIVNQLIEKINGKQDKVEDTLTLGNIQITADERGLRLTDASTGNDVFINIGTNNAEHSTVITGNNSNNEVFIPHLRVGLLSALEQRMGSSNKLYCLPDSSSDTKSRAVGRDGGGLLLSSRYRYQDRAVYDGADSRDTMVVDLMPFVYTVVKNVTSVEVNVQTSDLIDEYWLDIQFSPESSPEVSFLGKDIKWAGTEPYWESLGGKRVQLHIMDDIATYTTVE